MARAPDEYSSLRFGRRECERIVVALLLSLIIHAIVLGGYKIGQKRGWWHGFEPPAWLMHLTGKKFALDAHIGHDRPPDIFVDVSHADDDAPAKTKFYSNKNSRAANPDEANSNVPKIAGTQTDYAKTETAPKLVKSAPSTPEEGKDKSPKVQPKEEPKEPPKETPKAETPPQLAKLEPAMPPPSLPPLTPPPEPPPETPQTPGETDQRKPQKDTPPNPTPDQTPSPPQPERPRTLKQALAQRDQLPGQQMQQDGGVERRAMWSTLDVKNTAFGDYDRELIEAVQQRWDDLLDNHRYAQDRDGKVTLRFKLKPDGTVIEMQTTENNVGEVLGYLCQEAVEEAAPFAKWPPDMARMIGTNYRDITFTFYYY